MKTKINLTLLFALLFTGVSAQMSHVDYFMNIPQNHLLNPAFRPSSKIYVGIPVLTGINLNISNDFFNFSDVFTKGVKIDNNSLSFLKPGFNVSGFLSRVKNKNFFQTGMNIQLLGFGIAVGPKNYFFLDINDRVNANIVLPGSLIKMAFQGVQPLAGKTIDLSATRVDLQYFHEVGFGFSRDIMPKLRIGAKGKLLFGVASLSGRANTFNLTVNNDYTTTLTSDAILHNNGAIQFTFDNEGRIDGGDPLIGKLRGHDVGKYLVNGGNFGLGLDLGAEYAIDKRFSVSAAVTDLGFINWKADERTPNVKTRSQVEFHGFDFTKIYDGTITIDSLAKTMSDTLKNAVIRDNPGKFRSYLPTTFTVGGLFNLNDLVSFGVISSSSLVDRQLREALTLSGNLHVKSIFDFSLTYTIANRSYNNLGAGFSVRGGCAQFYFLVDRIPLTWASAGDNQNKVKLPANWNTINTWFGINLVFGNTGKNPHTSGAGDEK